jgi:hypothetical protein
MAEQPPSPTELVYLTRPSWLPGFAAAGIVTTVVGLFTWFPYLIVGAVIGLVAIYRWIRSTADDVARLPRHQRPVTSPIPLTAPPAPEPDEA